MHNPGRSEQVDAFLSSLSQTGTVSAIEVRPEVSAVSLMLDVTYEFADLSANDGKPLVLAVVNTPFRVRAARADCARLSDPDAGRGEISMSTGAILIEPTTQNWREVRVELLLEWFFGKPRDGNTFLTLPEELPPIISGNFAGAGGQSLPRFELHFAPGTIECLAGGIVEGNRWPGKTARLEMLQAVIAPPGTQLVVLHSPDERFSVALAGAAVTGGGDQHVGEFAKFHAGLLSRVQEVFRVPLSLRNVAVIDQELPANRGPGVSTIIPFNTRDAGPLAWSDEYASELVQLFTLAWWGAGIKVSGPLKEAIQLGLAMCVSLLVLQERLDLPINTDSMSARLVQRSGQSSDTVLAASGPLGVSLFEMVRFEPAEQQALRDLTRAWWGLEVPGREFVEWCTRRGVEVPSALLRDS